MVRSFRKSNFSQGPKIQLQKWAAANSCCKEPRGPGWWILQSLSYGTPGNTYGAWAARKRCRQLPEEFNKVICFPVKLNWNLHVWGIQVHHLHGGRIFIGFFQLQLKSIRKNSDLDPRSLLLQTWVGMPEKVSTRKEGQYRAFFQ